MQQASRLGRRQQRKDQRAARALPHHGHVVSVAAERRNVRLGPFERRDDVKQTVVPDQARPAAVAPREAVQSEEARNPKSVLDRYHHGGTAGGEVADCPVPRLDREGAPFDQVTAVEPPAANPTVR